MRAAAGLILSKWIGSAASRSLLVSELLLCDLPISQAVVRGDTVETKQEAEWTVIPETAASQQEVISSEQEVLER